MTWYLVIRSDSRYSESHPAATVTGHLDAVPELRRTDLTAYVAEGGPLGQVQAVSYTHL